MKYYTGVGSRKTPPEIITVMSGIAYYLANEGYILRSGGAIGADTAFEVGCRKANGGRVIYLAQHSTPECEEIAAKYHGGWDKCSDFVKKLHGRNVKQVLGDQLAEPSKFLLCWTNDGCVSHSRRSIATGGTGTAISVAEAVGVEVWNLKRADHLMHWLDWLKTKFK